MSHIIASVRSSSRSTRGDPVWHPDERIICIIQPTTRQYTSPPPGDPPSPPHQVLVVVTTSRPCSPLQAYLPSHSYTRTDSPILRQRHGRMEMYSGKTTTTMVGQAHPHSLISAPRPPATCTHHHRVPEEVSDTHSSGNF